MCVVNLLFVTSVASCLLYWNNFLFGPKEIPQVPDTWFGHGNRTDADDKITKFTIDVPQEVISDLKNRLTHTRFAESLEDTEFQYGFNSKQLQVVVKYWSTKYDWRKAEKELNKYKHYKTQIDGLSIHFMRVQPASHGANVEVVPLLLVHGWPGSFVEYYKIIPELQKMTQERRFIFDIIVPSIPGYGFSEGPHKQGFDVTQAAKIFDKLLARLGYNKYYLQAGDGGSNIINVMSIVHPRKVIGMHTTMPVVSTSPMIILRDFVGGVIPNLVYTHAEADDPSPFFETQLKFFLMEGGYFLIQSTNPDTVGTALQDSPAGLAAYILEKFSTWTDQENRNKPDGGLSDKFTLDELLTNVMIYWVNGNITSSQRFFKETTQNQIYHEIIKFPVLVPVGVAVAGHGIPEVRPPKSYCEDRYANLVTYNRLPRGGVFIAMEEPALLAEDIVKFVATVRTRPSNDTN